MQPVPGQLVLFEIDARGQSLVLQPGQPLPPPDRGQPAPAHSSTRTRVDDGSAVAAVGPAANDLAGLLAGYLSEFARTAVAQKPSPLELRQARRDWLRRLQTARRSESAIAAYRIAIDDLLDWSEGHGRSVFEEQTIVDYLTAYEEQARPAPATYYRRFGLLRCFFRWLSRRGSLPDPFLELQPPPKPQQEADWLTEAEFTRLLAAAEHPPRRRRGLAERDRLVLLTLVQTGLRRSELIALDWADLELAGPRPTLLVRRGKGGKPRRQPLAPIAGARARSPAHCPQCARRGAGLLRSRGQAPAANDPGRDHPPCRRASRDREARHSAHAPPHRCHLAAPADRRRPPRRRVSRPRRSLHRQPLRPRCRGRAARSRGGAGCARGDTGRSLSAPQPSVRPSSSSASRRSGSSPSIRADEVPASGLGPSAPGSKIAQLRRSSPSRER